jgi:hypothetical protein
MLEQWARSADDTKTQAEPLDEQFLHKLMLDLRGLDLREGDDVSAVPPILRVALGHYFSSLTVSET